MWKHTLPPVVLVLAFWLVTSSATIWHAHWMETAYQEILRENVASFRAADSLRAATWRAVSALGSRRNGFPPRDGDFDAAGRELETSMRSLADSAHTPVEQAIIATLAPALEELRRAGAAETGGSTSGNSSDAPPSARLREIAIQVDLAANALRKINQSYIDDAGAKLDSWRWKVSVARVALIVGGPAFGIWFGLRLSRRLQRDVGTLSITLRDAVGDRDVPLGEFELEPAAGLRGIQDAARQVVEKMRHVSRELRDARSELIRSERLAAVGELAAGVAHEMRNPLTSVKLMLQRTARQGDGASLPGDKLQFVLEEIGRMESTIQGLLDFSRPRTRIRHRHDLRETLRRSLNLIDGRLHQQHVSLVTHVEDRPFRVEGDSEQLSQVFVNVLLNGLDSMPTGGTLTVEASVVQDRGIASVRVLDEGRGIPAELADRLFEPFATMKERGTGLGLAVSRRIVEDHDGTIRGENRPDRGAVFTIEIPLVPEPETAGGDDPAAGAAAPWPS